MLTDTTTVLRPTSVAEVAELLRAAHRDGRTVMAAGGRTKLGWAPDPTSMDLLLDTTGLDRVVEHTAGDLVAIAEAGVRLSTLQEKLGSDGQWLALDPPELDATLGGIVSANASGPRRLRFGTVRDLLIGITVVLADGTQLALTLRILTYDRNLEARAGNACIEHFGFDVGDLHMSHCKFCR